MAPAQRLHHLHHLLVHLCASEEEEEHRIPWPTTSECVTEGVKVFASSSYDALTSRPEKKHWQWKYAVTISNESQQLIQVLSRHWIVTDATGKTFQVGPKAYGVVGQQPMLRPGESFRYTSLCPLATELGTMHGSFEILILEPVQMNGQRFQAEIGRFGLTLKGEGCHDAHRHRSDLKWCSLCLLVRPEHQPLLPEPCKCIPVCDEGPQGGPPATIHGPAGEFPLAACKSWALLPTSRLESRAFTTYTGEVQVHDVFGLPSTVKRHVVRLDVATDSLLTLQTEVHRDTPTTLAVDIFRHLAATVKSWSSFAGEICLEPVAKTPRTTSLALVLLGAVAACASLAFTLAAPSRPMASNLPQHARPAMLAGHLADGTPLLGPRGLMRLVSCNKTGLMLMMVFSVAICLFTALEKQFVGELSQYCFIAKNRSEFWPRMRKVMVVLLLSPLCNWAYQLSALKTSNDVKFSLQTAAFPRVLDSGTFPEGAAASLFTGELDKLTNISEKFLRGVVGCVVFSCFIWRLVRRGNARFQRIFGTLMLIVVVGVGISVLLQGKVGPAARDATRASREVANVVVAEVNVAEETRAYHATLERAKKLKKVMWTGIEKQLEHGKQRELWKTLDSMRQNGNLMAIHFLLGVAVMEGEFPFAVYHASFVISINLALSLRDLLQGLARVICNPPELLLLDEPTSALDVELEKDVFETMKRLAKEHSMMILMVTHRVTLAEQSDQAFLHGLLSGKDHQVDIVFDLVSMDVVSSQVDSKVSEAKCWPVRIDLTAVPVARAALHWPSVCPSEDRLPKPIGSNAVVLGDRGLEFSGGASHFAYRFAEERPWTAFQKPLWSSTLEVPPRLHRFVRFFMRVSFRFASGPLQAGGRMAWASPNLP
ncbi:unnamed protein product [Cladocopium goreaui]|uniref:Protein ApaG n=1 Tax=Cladocopium goreaui TaxID=2562237 RepID=A0A9P1FHE7_9DINO|nr:unnamed protein product [Cladocopium goreaui]